MKIEQRELCVLKSCFGKRHKMKPFTSRSWPSRYMVFLMALNFILQAALLFWFPLHSPCHWSVEGDANGYMNKYLYLLFYLLPPLVAWVLARKPRNATVAYFYDTPLGGVARNAVLVLTILATWIPDYAILLVPRFVPAEQQAMWIAAMVYTVEAVLDVVVVLFVILCAAGCLRWKFHGPKETRRKAL